MAESRKIERLQAAIRQANLRVRKAARQARLEAALARIAGQHVLTLSEARTLAREALKNAGR
jgi:hypothetical protein